MTRTSFGMPTTPNARSRYIGQINELMKQMPMVKGQYRQTPNYGRDPKRENNSVWVGYTWSRLYSSPTSGLVYTRVFGRGNTLDEAMADARAKIKVQAARLKAMS